MRLLICLIAVCVASPQVGSRRKYGGRRAEGPRPKKRAFTTEEPEEPEPSTTTTEAPTTTVTTEDVGVACDAEHLFRSGVCICDENPCFHYSSMLEISRGRQIPYLMRAVMTALRNFIAISPEHSVYDVHDNPDLPNQLGTAVRALATAVSRVHAILDPSQAEQAAELSAASDAMSSDDDEDGAGLGELWFEQLRREGLRKRVIEFLAKTVRRDLDYITLRDEVDAITNSLVNLSTDHSIRVPVLYLQARLIIDKYVLGTAYPSFESGGWDSDIRALGVNVDDLLPAAPVATNAEDAAIGRLADMQDLAARAVLVREALDSQWYIETLPSDRRQLLRFSRELETLVSSPEMDAETAAFSASMHEAFCPNMRSVLKFVDWVTLPHARTKGKLITNFIRFCDPPTEEKVRLTQEFMFTFDTEFVQSLIDPEGARPLRLRVPLRHAGEYIRESTRVLEGSSGAYRFPRGIDIVYSDTNGEGDGIRRDWFEKMIKHYFKVYDPDHPKWAATPARSSHYYLWEYTDSSQTTIRPRRYDVASTEDQRTEMKRRFQACGRLIGIGIRYGIIPGISLSAATLAHLHRPKDNFDAIALAALEDAVYSENLDKLALIDWENPDEVELTIADATVKVNGHHVPVTEANVNEYIRQKKFRKVVWSLHREMHAVRSGVIDFIRPGTLNLFSETEIMRLTRGSGDITAGLISAGIAFPVPAPQNAWLVEIITAMTQDELKSFHKFVTGSSMPPIRAGEAGFTWMSYQRSITIPAENLPTARTCFGVITSPAYDSRADFETKLKKAIAEGATVELQ